MTLHNRTLSNKIIALLLACVMILSVFTACDSNSDGSSDTGQNFDAYLKRYDLTEIGDIESVLCMEKYSDSYIVLGQDSSGKLVSYTSSDGLTWDSAELWQPEDGSYITAADVSADSKVIMAVSGVSISLMSLDIPSESDASSGASEPTEIISVSAASVSDVRFSADGSTFYVGTESGVDGYDMSGKKTVDIQLEGMLDFCDTEDGLLVLAEDSLGVYNVADGRLTKEYTGVTDALGSQLTDTAFAMGKDALSVRRIMKCDGQTAYMALEDGLYKADLTSDMAIKISGDDYKISNEVLYDYVTDDTSGEEMVTAVVCNLTSGSSKLAVGYSAKELQTNMASSEQKADSDNTDESSIEIYTDEEPCTITVYSLRYALYMEELIQAYEAKHPNIQVEYRYGVSSENGVTVSDAIKALNTELLSGEGPDVLLMDGLDIDDYADSGVLMELSDVYDEILDKNPNCLEKVMSAYRQDDGSIYAIPSKEEFTAIIAPESDIDNLNTISDITEYVKKFVPADDDINALNIYEWEILFDIFYPLYSADIVDDNDNYDAETLRTFLADIKALWDELLAQTSDSAMEKWKMDVEADEVIKHAALYMKPLADRVYSGQNISVGNWCEFSAAYNFYSIKENEGSNNDDLRYKVMSYNDSAVYVPRSIFSICASTQNVEGAKSFVEEMYSTNLQMKYTVMEFDNCLGMFVNLDAIQADTDWMLSIGPDPGGGGRYGNVDVGISFYLRTEVDMDDFAEKLKLLDKPSNNNLEIRNMIKDGMTDYMNNLDTIDGCAESIGDELELYLSE